MSQPQAVVVGAAIRIKGKVKGAEDLVLRGQVEGTVTLHENHLIIEDSALMVGDVDVKNVTVRGEHAGDARATDRVQLDATARVLGDVHTPRLVVADGAKFKGRVDMPFELPAELRLKYRD
ncbi:MAG: polymer-forming cytoskeletal protein [Myxococcota bacterium]